MIAGLCTQGFRTGETSLALPDRPAEEDDSVPGHWSVSDHRQEAVFCVPMIRYNKCIHNGNGCSDSLSVMAMVSENEKICKYIVFSKA